MRTEAARDSFQLTEALWIRGRNAFAGIAALGWAASIYGVAGDATQFHASYLAAFLFCLSIAWGATFFVMVQHVTSAAWSVTVRRLMENLMATMPVLAVLFVPVVVGIPTLYEWGTAGFFDPANPNLEFKAIFFSQPFYLIRSAVYFTIWIVLALALYGNSVAQDEGRNLKAYENTKWWSGPGLLILTITVTMASVDWVMSLDPFWYSTIFGIYVFSGGGLAFMAALTAASLTLRSQGALRHSIHVEHYHDLGKWMFALTVWWAYIAFSQYMLIWYADIPEETAFYKARFTGTWMWVTAALVIGRFAVPFLLLMSRQAKRKLGMLWVAAVWILVFHFVDLHWLIVPSVHEHGFHFHWIDVATLMAVGGVFGLAFWWRLRRHAMIPTGDLRLEQALAHHNT